MRTMCDIHSIFIRLQTVCESFVEYIQQTTFAKAWNIFRMRSILAGIATSFKLTYFKVVLNFSA
jgi:hypothetical protein